VKIKFHPKIMTFPEEIEWQEAMVLGDLIPRRTPKEEPEPLPKARVVSGVKHFDSAEKSCYDAGCAVDCPVDQPPGHGY